MIQYTKINTLVSLLGTPILRLWDTLEQDKYADLIIRYAIVRLWDTVGQDKYAGFTVRYAIVTLVGAVDQDKYAGLLLGRRWLRLYGTPNLEKHAYIFLDLPFALVVFKPHNHKLCAIVGTTAFDILHVRQLFSLLIL